MTVVMPLVLVIVVVTPGRVTGGRVEVDVAVTVAKERKVVDGPP